MKSKLDEAFNSLIEKGYNVVYIGYYGAHNYNLADEKSDYDFKAIIEIIVAIIAVIVAIIEFKLFILL